MSYKLPSLWAVSDPVGVDTSGTVWIRIGDPPSNDWEPLCNFREAGELPFEHVYLKQFADLRLAWNLHQKARGLPGVEDET